MKLEGDYLFEAPVQEVWSALFDPRVLAAVMPGCEKLELQDGSFVGELNIKIGPVQGKFAGKVELKDVDEPKGYTMIVDGKGSTGFMKATASVKLEAEGEGTRIRYSADAQVGGKIASVGQRLVEVSARAITKQSLEGLHENIKIRAEASAQAAAAKKARQEAKEAAIAEAAVAEKIAPEAAPAVEAPVVAEADAAPEAEVGQVPAAAAPEEAKSTPAETKAPVTESASPPSPASEVESPPPADGEEDEPDVPAPVLKKVDQAAFAASVAKEVSKELVPAPVRIALVLGVLALVAWLVWRMMG